MNVINYINKKIMELESLKKEYKEDNSRFNVLAIQKELFTLNSIKSMLEGDKNMKDNILERLEILEEELNHALVMGKSYKVMALKNEKAQLLQLLEECD